MSTRLKRELARSRRIEWAEFLRDRKALTPEQVRQALEQQDGTAMNQALVNRGWISAPELEKLAAEFRRLEFEEAPAPLPPEAREAAVKADRHQGTCILTTPLGRGGASVVWKAWDVSMGRWVAFKRSLVANSEQSRERFRREALAAGRLLHPNIVPVYSSGDSDGQPWLVMAYIDGHTLEERKLPLGRTLELLKTIAEAVQFAHDHGVIHRDLKPANLLLDRSGTPWVCDFGIAHLHEAARLTATGAVLGTAPYMAPEQASGAVIDRAESLDVYALGATLYKLATGRLPFEGDSFAEVLRKVAESEPLPPRRIEPAIPPDVEAIIQKAMERDPRRRYESARAFAQDLGRHLKGDRVLARPLSPALQFLRRRKFRRTAAIAVAALGLAVAGFSLRTPSPDGALARLEAARMELDGATALLYDGEAPADRLRSRLVRARDLVRKTLDAAPQLAFAHHRHGEVLELEGRFEEAQASWETALKIDPGLTAARFRLGKVLLTRASLANMNIWSEPRGSRSSESEALAAEGARQIERTRTQESGFETDLEKDLASAMRAYARGERETVYGICRDAIARFKGQRGVEEFHWLDGLSREPDNREASIASYTRALEARPKFGLALYCRAMDTRALGRNPTVMADLDQVIQLCPGFSDALLTRASLNTFNKDHRAAVEDFDALIRDGKLAAAAHNGRGYARWKQGDLEGALADLTTAIRLEPDGHAQAYGFRAKIHLEKGDVDGAIRDASRGHQIGNAMFCKSVLVEALVAKKDPVAGLACLDRLGIFLDDPCRRPLREQIPP